jgi:site-specific recombinase XerD
LKKDLERAGIPYETGEGIADLHAVGRHTYITELLRNGASLVEARELARHSDIRIYNQALSVAEVKTLYEFEKP